MRFFDRAKIQIHAGDGGNGAVSFLRARAVPKGGPDGGDGGDGGDIIAICVPNLNSLADYHHRWIFRAVSGQAGSGRGRAGKAGGSVEIPLPEGTQIFNAESGELLADMVSAGQRCVLLAGGKGGAGNRRFKSSVRQAPRFAVDGEKGGELELFLRLKLVADGALVGLPNAGKTSLLAALSGSRGKIAPYPYTTRHPELGVLTAEAHVPVDPPVLADLPALDAGAAEGAGLGAGFLVHLERCHYWLHLVDATLGDITGALGIVRREMAKAGASLEQKKEIVLLTKSDLAEKEVLTAARKHLLEEGREVFIVSASSGAGLEALRARLLAA